MEGVQVVSEQFGTSAEVQATRSSARALSIASYIAQYSSTHDRGSIEAALLQAGHDRATLDDVWGAIDYIVKYRDQYPRPNIEASLEQAGWSSAVIAVLWDAIGKRHSPSAQSRAGGQQTLASMVAASPSTIIRTYVGKQQADTTAAFQAEARYLASCGYIVKSQSWAPGQWGCGAFLVAVLLFIVLIGILVFLYLLIVKPDGTLTVVFERTAQPQSQPARASGAASADVGGRLRHLTELHDAGAITDEEYAARRAEILRDI